MNASSWQQVPNRSDLISIGHAPRGTAQRRWNHAEGIQSAVRSRKDRACLAAGGRGGGLKPGQAAVLLPPKEGETDESPVAYRALLRQALIDDNVGHVNVVVCEEDYRALKRGIEQLPPPMQ